MIKKFNTFSNEQVGKMYFKAGNKTKILQKMILQGRKKKERKEF